jgi:thioredoxin 1
MPTFIVFKDGEKVDEVVGADPGKMERLVRQYA